GSSSARAGHRVPSWGEPGDRPPPRGSHGGGGGWGLPTFPWRPALAARGVIQQVFPLHEQRILKRLMKSWVQAVCEAQPLDEICDYFGVKIAMYFAWLGFYTSAMVYPAVFGSILYTFTESDQTSQDICCVVFAIFNVIWATLFLEEWKRRGAEFAYKWGTLDTPAESIEEPRPQFRGVKRISPVTSAEEFYYPPWKRLLFQCLVSLPVCLFCLSFVFLVMLGCFQLQVGGSPSRRRRESDSEDESALDCGLKLKKVSFIEKAERRGGGGGEPGGAEDDSFLEEGSPTMVEKGMDPASVFELCEDEEEAEGPPGSPARAPEPAAPLRAGRRRRAAESREEEEGEEEGRRQNRASWIDPPEEDYSTQLTQAEVESCMKKYEDTFQDYQEMFIQFGYVVLFSSAFPLAAMCALVNNVIEIRSDAFKLCTGLQRPFGQRVESIGQWQKVMEAMGVLAIVVNCYLIAQCGQLQRLFPWLSPEGAIISVVVLEHFALFLKYVIQVAIPDIPAWVAEEMAKLEYQRREAFKKHERQAQHHFQQQQRRKREEEERQRHAEYQARKERESGRDEAKAEAAGQDPAHDKSQSKGKGAGAASHASDKPKRPSSLLATNNVMKLKQIIPLQGKSPQSPTGSDNKLPGFLSFKFLKSPETKRDAGTEKVQSPTKPFNPGKLFNFGKSEGAGGNGAAAATASPQPRPGPSSDAGEKAAPGRSQLNGAPDEGGREEPELRAEEESGGYKL
uniref:Anoctamin n=1 Tax=Dromaius novaehollandiae TaxID=8790 RepID=A0A8C4PAY2_DRONO